MEIVNQLRSQLSQLESTAVVVGEDGIRYTFFPPGIAHDCVLNSEEWVHPSYGAGMKSHGASLRARRGFLWPIEEFVYAHERSRIIGEMLQELHNSSFLPRDKEHLDNDVSPFIEDFGKALDRVRARDKKPKPDSKARMQIKFVNGAWWLFHRQWMPLCFESFEEAVVFAKRYIAKVSKPPHIALARSPW
ncbi:MAG: hypothetical protein M3O09_04530 [Acidobacteriota bacterium]|nr:hypothetical protein [Acidobacteriota bacterium]